MPYEWHQETGDGSCRLLAWRHRSLTPRGFVWAISLAAGMLALPLVALIGSRVVWGLLPFALAAVVGLWWAMQLPFRHGGTREALSLDRSNLTIRRSDPGRADRLWSANPYWVRIALRPGPVDDYLTLTDGTREVELGAFLTPEERRTLYAELSHALESVRAAPGAPRPAQQ